MNGPKQQQQRSNYTYSDAGGAAAGAGAGAGAATAAEVSLTLEAWTMASRFMMRPCSPSAIGVGREGGREGESCP